MILSPPAGLLHCNRCYYVSLIVSRHRPIKVWRGKTVTFRFSQDQRYMWNKVRLDFLAGQHKDISSHPSWHLTQPDPELKEINANSFTDLKEQLASNRYLTFTVVNTTDVSEKHQTGSWVMGLRNKNAFEKKGLRERERERSEKVQKIILLHLHDESNYILFLILPFWWLQFMFL